MNVDWTDWPATKPEPSDWAELADRAVATGQPWAEELARSVATFEAIADFVDGSEPPGPVVLTHRDVQPWNLLNRAGHPVVLDWEISGRMEVSSELASTALGLSKGSTFEDVDDAVLRSVLDGYVAGGGSLPPVGPDWFAYMIGGWLDFTRRNIVRCVRGWESPTGVELEFCHDEVRNGSAGCPTCSARSHDSGTCSAKAELSCERAPNALSIARHSGLPRKHLTARRERGTFYLKAQPRRRVGCHRCPAVSASRHGYRPECSLVGP